MTDTTLLSSWVRRFLLEYLVSERNLARNTQRSYRDTLGLLLPFVTRHAKKKPDRLTVTDLSAEIVRRFLQDLEDTRKCGLATRNQRQAPFTSINCQMVAFSIRKGLPDFVIRTPQ
jgi:integrase/recombinase XerD